ncbi:MAG TPA: hypothetical protein VHL58_04810 [Thermoanaerobaculia bacterium]|nr:hypothetical protein [Thermoanaerobaculia bacterium]
MAITNRLTGSRVALAVFATHLVAALVMLVFLRDGLLGQTAEERLVYVRAHPVSWSLSWMLWQLAALTLLALYAHLGRLWWSRSPTLVTLALLCAAAAIGADVGGQSLYMGMPRVLDAASFQRLEVAAALVTGYAANGLYTVAGALLTVAGVGQLPRRIVSVSILLWSSGFALAAASLAQSLAMQQITTAAMLGSLFVWTLMLSSWLRNSES